MVFDNSDIKLMKKDLDKGLELPNQISSELAEIIGIHFGDGHMTKKYRYTYKITYTCNLLEEPYVKHILNLFSKIFNISLKIYRVPDRGCFVLSVYSKALCDFFNKKLCVPYSPKNNLQIPLSLYQEKEYLASFLRGLFDTDGCIITQEKDKYRYPLVRITTKSKDFADSIFKALLFLEIPSYICTKSGKNFVGYDVVARNKNAKKFFKIVGSNNPKNIKKMGTWGFEPQTAGITHVSHHLISQAHRST
jgi:intein/homing endonuclease